MIELLIDLGLIDKSQVPDKLKPYVYAEYKEKPDLVVIE